MTLASPFSPGPAAAKQLAQSLANYRDLVPLTDLTGSYKGKDGGLYGGGRNDPPAGHWAAYLRESEPHAYETAFAVRWLVQSQMRGGPALNFDPARGQVRAPLLLWGPYLWARGVTPRQSDGLVWTRADCANDGTHPSASSGRDKVARLLLEFFKNDPTARPWFGK